MPDVVVSLPVHDRLAAHAFYGAGLGLPLVDGDRTDDGLPEPLQHVLGAGVTLMLVPTDGFGWVLGDRAVAAPGTSETVLGLALDGAAAVDALAERAVVHGGTLVTDAAQQPWGYCATVADPDGHLWMLQAAAE
ncbi:VOC family protein [Aeromicrobium massiliense]|uniref:VOC family protein n=1 Tax=Aeromicrobium massiliense TaxID=1464554 RepID=UPI0002E466DB|nr:VOC family protein [Aeromicrobium massiliense]